uniref:golgin subfamily A member 6-like protein 7 n=1 Tax=Myodes glareolus TaxID=447135 RepID=UPI0020222A5F|nr:golgin subfamily A member 6-like protein 7 [Myodes glareolus]
MLSRLRSLLRRESGDHGETRVRKEENDHRSHRKTWRNKWSWGRRRTTGEAPSKLSIFTEQEQQMKEMEDLTIQLQSITYEQIELGGLLDNCHYKDLNNRLNSLEMREKEHKQVMLDLQKWPMEISDTLHKCKRLRDENESYSYLHSLVQRDLTELENNVHMLRVEKRKMWEEQIELQESCEEVKRLLKEIREKICDPCVVQQQEEESLDRVKNLGKQKELITQERDLPEKPYNHVNISEMRSENLQSELEQATAQDESLLPTELLQQED